MKVSYKVDINEYEGEPDDTLGLAQKKWHGIKKLSLENGDDRSVVAETLAWFIGTAAKDVAYPAGYHPGMANLATLTAHVVDSVGATRFDFSGSEEVIELGVYANVEQVDKTYLKNRDVWVSDQTYLYKQADVNAPEVKEQGCEDAVNAADLLYSPQYNTLNECNPFGNGRRLPDCTAAEVAAYLDAEQMLTQAAIEGFISSQDGFFTKGKNYYYVDYSDENCTDADLFMPRTFYEWDLDAAFLNEGASPYNGGVGGGKGKRNGRRMLKGTATAKGEEDHNKQRRLPKGGNTDDNGDACPTDQTDFQRIFFGEQEYLDVFNSKLRMLVDTNSTSIIGRSKAWLTEMRDNTDLPALLAADPNSKTALQDLTNSQTWLDNRQAFVEPLICSDASKQGICCKA